MSATVSTELLLRVAQATPEQQAAIERILLGVPGEIGLTQRSPESGGCGGMSEGLVRIEGKVDLLVAAARQPEKKEPLPEAECLRVLRLFGELLGLGTTLNPTPARVFDLMVFRKKTKAQSAEECRCAKSSITNRVKQIERHFNLSMEQLVSYASDLQERQRTVKSDRYAKRKRGAMREEAEQYSEQEKGTDMEDDQGFLPEERQGSD